MVHAASRCLANLIRTFVQQGHPESVYPNLYLNSLFRCYVLGELEPEKVKRPPYYTPEVFSIIREAEEGDENTLAITTRGWQMRIMERGVTHQRDVETGMPEIIQTGQEERLKQANWMNIWMLRRKSGLTPDQKSWFFKWTEGLHVNNERLWKIGKIIQSTCDFCDQPDNRSHILHCEFNKRVGQGLQKVLETCTGAPVSEADSDLCDLSLPSSLQLPVLFIFCEVTQQLQRSREKNQTIKIEKMYAEIKAKAEAFLLTKKYGFAHCMICMWLDSFFADERVMVSARPGAAEALPAGRVSPAATRDPAHPHGLSLPVVPRGVGV